MSSFVSQVLQNKFQDLGLKKRKLDYKDLELKAKRQLNFQLKNQKLAEELELAKHRVGKGNTFEPASAHKRFDSESIVMKQIYKNL